MKIFERFGFENSKQWKSFLTIVTSGQIIYCSFEAFKASFYTPLLEVLNITNAQFGILFSLIGSAMFFYIPAGWLNNRFTPRQLLSWGLILRAISTGYIILIPNISFNILAIIALLWGIIDSFFWPAVLNGTRLFSTKDNLGIAFGLLESVRRALELGMNILALFIFTYFGGTPEVMKIIMGLYTVIIVIWVLLVHRYVPNLQLLKSKTESGKNEEAWQGLLKALVYPEVWLSGIIGMAVYTCYISVIYSVPYMQSIFGLSSGQAAIFGLFNASGIGIVGGLIAGYLGDKVFKSPTKMLQFFLFSTIIILILTVIMPKDPKMLKLSMGLMFLYSLVIFISRSVFFAPIGEANIPKAFSGAAMSIGSFFTYSPIFWAYGVNGYIIDKYKNTPQVAYELIFSIGIVFAVVGFIASTILTKSIQKKKSILES